MKISVSVLSVIIIALLDILLRRMMISFFNYIISSSKGTNGASLLRLPCTSVWQSASWVVIGS